MYNTDELKYIIAGAVIYGRLETKEEINSLLDDELSEFLIKQVGDYCTICETSNYTPSFHIFMENAFKERCGW